MLPVRPSRPYCDQRRSARSRRTARRAARVRSRRTPRAPANRTVSWHVSAMSSARKPSVSAARAATTATNLSMRCHRAVRVADNRPSTVWAGAQPVRRATRQDSTISSLAGPPETLSSFRVAGMRAPGLTAAPLVIAGLGRVRERLDRAARNRPSRAPVEGLGRVDAASAPTGAHAQTSATARPRRILHYS